MCDLFVLRVDSLFLLLLPSTSIFDQRYVVLPLASYQICHGCHKLNWATHCLARVHFENISSDDNLNYMRKYSTCTSWGSYILIGKVDDFWITFDPLAWSTYLLVAADQDVLLFKHFGPLGMLLFNRYLLLTEAYYYLRQYGTSYFL